ncbi:MAG: peptide deformylase [Parcubacteria group bacterium Athens0714_26]|nr:MAG: peptide deformylase [Parcubacteria group bacterium Athens1014_26]TSD03811.1 MAG: peptide deformylase [Parcubacteria group bacterium Athens0714_26]
MIDLIFTINDKKEEKFLRRKTSSFNFAKHKKQDIKDLIIKMRNIMKKASGIGLSANQIGLDSRFFIAKVENKFYTVFNPEIAKESKETATEDEGCLSVPDLFGPVERAEKITLTGSDANNKKIKIKAWGLLSRVFQHEIDHLNGKLFIDKAKTLRKYENGHENTKKGSSL